MCVVFYFSFIWVHVYAFAIEAMVHCGSASARRFRAPYYCTPPVCVPAVLAGLAVWRHNNKTKTIKRTPSCLLKRTNKQIACWVVLLFVASSLYVYVRLQIHCGSAQGPLPGQPHCAPLVGVLIRGVAVWRLYKQTNKQVRTRKGYHTGPQTLWTIFMRLRVGLLLGRQRSRTLSWVLRD